jgi:PiT family inorganic phosphate transporter
MEISLLILLILCLLLVCAFEFINGFHDTANAVAPVIYSNSLTPKKAVILAAIFNFLGVILGGIGVAMGIIHLLPLDLIANQPVGFGVAVVLSLLLAAIVWNFGTWYLGIPASSSHTLIGSILGVSLAMYIIDATGVTIPWTKVIDTFKSLLLSPFIGFLLAFGAMHGLHLWVKNKEFFTHPGRIWNKYPKTWIKTTLIGSSAFVSFAHGSNDGQKGVGLAMLILISLLPATFAINPSLNAASVHESAKHLSNSIINHEHDSISKAAKESLMIIEKDAEAIVLKTQDKTLTTNEKIEMRKEVLQIQKEYKKL